MATLAFPFMLNSAVQAVLNATDTWFIGRLSPAATSAIGAVYWPILVCVLLFGGVGLAVQTLVAQAYGARRYTRASQATWTALWASLFTVPLFILLSLGGCWIFAPFGIPPETLRLALEYWFPRMLGGPLAIALWSLLGFFNGIGRPTITLWVTLERRRRECLAEPAVHVRLRAGHCRIRLGDRCRAVDRGRRGGSIVPGQDARASATAPISPRGCTRGR